MNVKIKINFIIFILLGFISKFDLLDANNSNLKTLRDNHADHESTNDDLVKIANLGNDTQFRSLLDPILIPRVVGSDGHAKVRQYIVQQMELLGWAIELDTFMGQTPIGRLEFNNIVAKLNPEAPRFLVLACHYDSKYFREGSFLGATDSAVPCAMMLHLAASMDKALKKSKTQSDVSLKFIFFDGEEAFKRWGPTDSIYGARHLARKLENTAYTAYANSNHLQRMDVMVLLDLIGAPHPNFFSFFQNTEKWYNILVRAEKRLAENRLLTGYSYGMDGYPHHKYFQERSTYAGIEDDHVPFMERGVPILHLIPYPFPDVWHTERDNLLALDFDTIDNLNKILRVFVTEYLNLKILN